MVKFWKEDFKYVERHFYVSDPLGFTSYYYVFTVCGESANYLMNKYNLNGHDMKIGFFEVNNHILVGSCNERWKDIDMDDIYELLNILQKEVKIDKINYYEYLCDSEYNKYDSRWK